MDLYIWGVIFGMFFVTLGILGVIQNRFITSITSKPHYLKSKYSLLYNLIEITFGLGFLSIFFLREFYSMNLLILLELMIGTASFFIGLLIISTKKFDGLHPIWGVFFVHYKDKKARFLGFIALLLGLLVIANALQNTVNK